MSPPEIGAVVAIGCALSALIPTVWGMQLERKLALARQLLKQAGAQHRELEHDVTRWRELYLAERRANPPDRRLTTLWRR